MWGITKDKDKREQAQIKNYEIPPEKKKHIYCESCHTLAQLAERDCGLSILGDIQSLTGHSPWQTVLAVLGFLAGAAVCGESMVRQSILKGWQPADKDPWQSSSWRTAACGKDPRWRSLWRALSCGINFAHMHKAQNCPCSNTEDGVKENTGLHTHSCLSFRVSIKAFQGLLTVE